MKYTCARTQLLVIMPLSTCTVTCAHDGRSSSPRTEFQALFWSPLSVFHTPSDGLCVLCVLCVVDLFSAIGGHGSARHKFYALCALAFISKPPTVSCGKKFQNSGLNMLPTVTVRWSLSWSPRIERIGHRGRLGIIKVCFSNVSERRIPDGPTLF